jgi:hypothetical protein
MLSRLGFPPAAPSHGWSRRHTPPPCRQDPSPHTPPSRRGSPGAYAVEVDPLADSAASVPEAFERPEPDALLFQAPEKALDHAVLLRALARDEFLAERVVPVGMPKSSALEDEAVVAADDRLGTLGTQRSEAGDAAVIQGSLGLSGSAPEGEFPPDDLAVVTVDHGHQVFPPIPTAVPHA